MNGCLEYYKIKIAYEEELSSYQFFRDRDYLKVGDDLLLNDNHVIRKIKIDNYFYFSKKIPVIKDVVFISNNDNYHCTKGKKYSVYSISVCKGYQKYQILNDNFEFEYIIEYCFKDSKNRNIEVEKEDRKFFLQDCLNLIKSQEEKKSFWKIIFSKFKKKTNLVEYERLKKQNNLPLEILGKIKKIENYIEILEFQKYSKDILNLLKTNVNLSLIISFEGNEEQLIGKINKYLDTTLEYIHSLEINKQLFNEEVELKLTENIIDILDDNETVMKELIKENNKNKESKFHIDI